MNIIISNFIKEPLTDAQKKAKRKEVVDDMRDGEGTRWKGYTREELTEIFGYLPSFAKDNP